MYVACVCECEDCMHVMCAFERTRQDVRLGLPRTVRLLGASKDKATTKRTVHLLHKQLRRNISMEACLRSSIQIRIYTHTSTCTFTHHVPAPDPSLYCGCCDAEVHFLSTSETDSSEDYYRCCHCAAGTAACLFFRCSPVCVCVCERASV